MPLSANRTNRRAWGLATAALVLGLVLAACGSAASDAETVVKPETPVVSADGSTTPPAAATSAPAPAENVPALLQFTGRTVAGDSFRGSSLAGRPVVLWFWAPWCAVCRSQAPKVRDLVAKYGDDLAVVGIGSLDSSGAIAGFAAQVQGPVQLSDPKGNLWKRFRIAEQSSFVVLDARGKEVLRTGYNDDGDLAEAVARVVG